MPEQTITKLSQDTPVTLRQLRTLIETKGGYELEDETSSSVIRLLLYSNSVLPGSDMLQKSRSFELKRKGALPTAHMDEVTRGLATIGDGLLKIVLKEMEMSKDSHLKYPIDVYCTNYYLSKIVRKNWPMFAVVFGNTHDYGTIYEWLLGTLWKYTQSKQSLHNFILDTLFTNQQNIVNGGIANNKLNQTLFKKR